MKAIAILTGIGNNTGSSEHGAVQAAVSADAYMLNGFDPRIALPACRCEAAVHDDTLQAGNAMEMQ